jgi:hypothetical protein
VRPYKWQPGQSGNPTGRGGLYLEWDPGTLSAEERADLKALLKKMVKPS